MSHVFNALRGLIVVNARVWGPRGPSQVAMALVTGATGTVISATVMEALGYDLKNCPTRIRMTSASGMATAPRIVTQEFEALGCNKRLFPIVCHNFPESASIEGLLGLDFFRGMQLTVDFRSGSIALK
jgi:predicted aspartyl protease